MSFNLQSVTLFLKKYHFYPLLISGISFVLLTVVYCHGLYMPPISPYYEIGYALAVFLCFGTSVLLYTALAFIFYSGREIVDNRSVIQIIFYPIGNVVLTAWLSLKWSSPFTFLYHLPGTCARMLISLLVVLDFGLYYLVYYTFVGRVIWVGMATCWFFRDVFAPDSPFLMVSLAVILYVTGVLFTLGYMAKWKVTRDLLIECIGMSSYRLYVGENPGSEVLSKLPAAYKMAVGFAGFSVGEHLLNHAAQKGADELDHLRAVNYGETMAKNKLVPDGAVIGAIYNSPKLPRVSYTSYFMTKVGSLASGFSRN